MTKHYRVIQNEAEQFRQDFLNTVYDQIELIEEQIQVYGFSQEDIRELWNPYDLRNLTGVEVPGSMRSMVNDLANEMADELEFQGITWGA